jgi:hypothetical protein
VPNGISTVRIVWEDTLIETRADDALNGDPEKNAGRDAEVFLLDALSGGPVNTKLLQESARHAGIAWATIRRKKSDIGIQAVKASGPGGAWSWSLPTKDSWGTL